MDNSRVFKNLMILALFAGALGCQGQNPFRRESNPVKNYESTRQAVNQPYQGPGAPAGLPSSAIQLTFKNIPQKLTFGQSFKFLIQVHDENADPNTAPSITVVPTPKNELAKNNVDPQSTVLDASQNKTVDCKTNSVQLDASTWQFTCTFTSNLLPNIDALLKTGQTANSAFSIKIIQTAPSKGTPALSTLILPVEFQMIDPKPSTDGSLTRGPLNLVSTGKPGVRV
jgi:hypothetical protein